MEHGVGSNLTAITVGEDKENAVNASHRMLCSSWKQLTHGSRNINKSFKKYVQYKICSSIQLMGIKIKI